MLSRVKPWVVVIDYHLPAPWRAIDSYHWTFAGAARRCRRALRPLALLTEVATITVTPRSRL